MPLAVVRVLAFGILVDLVVILPPQLRADSAFGGLTLESLKPRITLHIPAIRADQRVKISSLFGCFFFLGTLISPHLLR